MIKTYVSLCVLGILLGINNFAYAGDARMDNRIANPKPASLFVENKGQIIDQYHNYHNEIDFSLRTPGLNIFIGGSGLHYQFSQKDSITVADVPGMDYMKLETPVNENIRKKFFVNIYRLDVELLGANKNAIVLTEEKQDYHENYYLAHCKTTANSFRKITYKNVYPNIDWVLYAKDGSLKYDFIVHPGGDPRDIKLKYDGDTALLLTETGITAYTPLGSISEAAPFAYELETQKKISSQFVLNDKVLSIETGDHVGTLVIDPTIQWARYWGGQYNDELKAMAVRNGTTIESMLTYIAGGSLSYDVYLYYAGTAHTGSYNDGTMDAFIAAFQLTGQYRWSTFFGGTADECFNAVAVNDAGDLYAGGGTNSTSGIASGAGYRLTPGGQPFSSPGVYMDGFFVKLDTLGAPIWGSYYGGNQWEQINAMTLDRSNNLYIAGEVKGATAAFVSKFSNKGTTFKWTNSYSTKRGSAVVTDKFNNVYLAGCMFIPMLPPDAFVVKLDSAGTQQWMNIYGELSNDDQALAIAYDSTSFLDSSGALVDGLIYIGGITNSKTGIATPTGFTTTFQSVPVLPAPDPYDGFIIAMKSTGTKYWGTYLGGAGNDYIYGLNVDLRDLGTPFAIPRPLLVAGMTAQTGLATQDAYQRVLGGNYDGFFAVFNQAARQSFTYFGGTNTDAGITVAADTSGHWFLGGNTSSSSDIYLRGTTPLPVQTSFGGDQDAYIAQFLSDMPISFHLAVPGGLKPITWVCLGDSTFLPIVAENPLGNAVFQPGNTFTLQLSDSNGGFTHPLVLKAGSASASIPYRMPLNIPIAGNKYKVRVISSRPLMISDEIDIRLFPHVEQVSIITNSPVCVGDTLKIDIIDTLNIGISYEWRRPDSSIVSIYQHSLIPNMQPGKAGKYFLSAFNDRCGVLDTINVVVNPIPSLHGIKNNSPICTGDSLKLIITDTTSGVNYSWSGPNGFSSNQKNPVLENIPMIGAGKYIVNYDRLGCKGKRDSTYVVLYPSPGKPTASSNSPVCDGDTLRLSADNVVTGVDYIWTGPQGYYTQLPTPLRLSNPDVAGTYYVKSKLYNCTSAADSIIVVVKPKPPIPLVSSNSPVKEGSNLELTSTTIAGATYTWTGPNGFTSSEQNPILKKATPAATGSYVLLVDLDGCTSSGIVIVVVNEVAQTYFSLYPNPNKGVFNVKITLERDQIVPLIVFNEAGQEVYREEVTSTKRLIDHTITLPGSLANGVYFLKIRMDGNNRQIPFVLNQ